MKEEFEDTKGVIRIRISKKNIHNNDQKKKYKRTNNDLQNIHLKLKIEGLSGYNTGSLTIDHSGSLFEEYHAPSM
jgi:hypothetical protein